MWDITGHYSPALIVHGAQEPQYIDTQQTGSIECPHPVKHIKAASNLQVQKSMVNYSNEKVVNVIHFLYLKAF